MSALEINDSEEWKYIDCYVYQLHQVYSNEAVQR